MKTFKFTFSIIALVSILCLSSATVLAYFDRGPVDLVLASDNVTLKQGESVTVTAAADPPSDSQLPGCGMAECPQICGEKNCLNQDGDCTCAGSEAQIYYADISTDSSNSGVAKASYANGGVTITGVSAGEATITVTAMLRQYTATSKTISVTVTGSDAAPADKSESNFAPDDTGGKEIVVVKNSDQNIGVGSATENGSSRDAGFRSIETDKGRFDFYPITGGLTGKKEMETVAGTKATLVFQAKDSSDTILYSWSFRGQDISKPADLDMTIDISQKGAGEQAKLTKGSDALYLDFADNGKLPAPAEINVRVNEMFANDAVLNLYFYNKENRELELVKDGLKVVNGYVSFTLDHCSQYILSDGDLLKQNAGSPLIYAGIGILILAVVGFAILKIIRKRKSEFPGGRM